MVGLSLKANGVMSYMPITRPLGELNAIDYYAKVARSGWAALYAPETKTAFREAKPQSERNLSVAIEDGHVYLTGRVKDYFKTIQGKFVAPTPIENEFAKNPHTEQICLLGRGYSKTVMVCVLSGLAQQEESAAIEAALREMADVVNESVDKHARIGAVIISRDPWTIENSMLTPTLKIRREQVESQFGERARDLAREAAEQGELLAEWWQ